MIADYNLTQEHLDQIAQGLKGQLKQTQRVQPEWALPSMCHINTQRLQRDYAGSETIYCYRLHPTNEQSLLDLSQEHQQQRVWLEEHWVLLTADGLYLDPTPAPAVRPSQPSYNYRVIAIGPADPRQDWQGNYSYTPNTGLTHYPQTDNYQVIQPRDQAMREIAQQHSRGQ